MKFKLGIKLEDKLTGFKGVAFGFAKYLTGCDQYCLVPPAKDGAMVDAQWFDEGRLKILREAKVKKEDVKAEKNGGINRYNPKI